MGKQGISVPGMVRRLVYSHFSQGKRVKDIFKNLFDDGDNDPIE